MSMPVLTRERREKFINALRSGDYQQVTGSYFKQGCFCSIGVLMDLTHCGSTNLPVEDMLINVSENYLLDGNHIADLISMNDDEEMSFNEIADALINNGFLTDVDYQIHQPQTV